MASVGRKVCLDTIKRATALKMHCHYTITTLGPQTPPETFVYRGNAYQALDQPYLALADYNTAGRVLRLSGQHQKACNDAIANLPKELTAAYPAVDNHLHILVKPLLADGVDIKRIDDVKGRAVCAAKQLVPGDVVLKPTQPWLVYPLRDGLCSNCAKKLPTRIFACSNEKCHEEYCSRECRQTALSTYHGRVCMNEGFQGVELDLFGRMQKKDASLSEKNDLAAQLLTVRVIGAALLARCVPSNLPEVRTLTGKFTFDPRDVATHMLDVYERLSRFCGFSTSIFFEEFLGVYARIRSNSFSTDYHVAWNVPRSMLNHSCDPNTVYDAQTSSTVCCKPVQPDDELTISYYPHLNNLPSEARRIELERRSLVCLCPKCVAGY